MEETRRQSVEVSVCACVCVCREVKDNKLDDKRDNSTSFDIERRFAKVKLFLDG